MFAVMFYTQASNTPGCHIVVEDELAVVHPIAANLVAHVQDGHALTGGHVRVADPAQYVQPCSRNELTGNRLQL